MLGTAQAALEQNPWISGFSESTWLGNFEAEWLTLSVPILYLADSLSAITIAFSYFQGKTVPKSSTLFLHF